MPVYKVHKDNNFTTISNVHLRDQRLTLKAKGLFTMVLSLSDDWKYSISGLAAICKEGKSAVKSALKELKDCGYLTVTKVPPTEGNSTFDYLYEFYEKPLDTGYLGIENLSLESLALENQPQSNKDKSNTDAEKVKKQEGKREDQQRITNSNKGDYPLKCPDCGGTVWKSTGTPYDECPNCFKKFPH